MRWGEFHRLRPFHRRDGFRGSMRDQKTAQGFLGGSSKVDQRPAPGIRSALVMGMLWRADGNGKGVFGRATRIATGWQGYKAVM